MLRFLLLIKQTKSICLTFVHELCKQYPNVCSIVKKEQRELLEVMTNLVKALKLLQTFEAI